MAHDYADRLSEIMKRYFGGSKIHFVSHSVAEAKQHLLTIHQAQKELAMLKKDMNAAKKQINAHFTTEKNQVGKTGGAALGAMVFGKKAQGSRNATDKDKLRREQLAAVAPLDNAMRALDNFMLELDRMKMQLESAILGAQSGK